MSLALASMLRPRALSATLALVVPLVVPLAAAQEPPVVAPGAPSAPPKQPHDGRTVEIYDVRDFLPSNRGRRFVPVDISEPRSTTVHPYELGPAVPDDPERTAKEDEQCLALLSAYVRRLGVNGDVELTVDAKPTGALLVRAFVKTCQQIDDTFIAIRTDRTAIEVETQLLTLDPAQRAELEKMRSVARGEPATIADSFQPDVPAVQRFVAAHPSCVVKSPKVVVAPLRPFEVALGEQISYIAAIESVAIEGIGTIADPVVKTVREGLVVTGMAIAGAPQPDGGEPFALIVSMQTTVVKRPIATAKAYLGTIQMPEVATADMKFTLVGSSGSARMIGGIPVPSFDEKEDDRRHYVLVTVRVLPQPR
jgi:hypothetical protein